VHPTGGSRRVFKQFVWLEVGSGKAAFSRPTHPRVTQAVRRLVIDILDLKGDGFMEDTSEQTNNDEEIVIQVLPHYAVNDLQDLLITNNIDVAPISGRSLDGQAVTELLLIISSSGIITAVSNILVTWIKTHSDRRVKIGKYDIQGYSTKEVCEILEKVMKKRK